jgi:hypothetical protein
MTLPGGDVVTAVAVAPGTYCSAPLFSISETDRLRRTDSKEEYVITVDARAVIDCGGGPVRMHGDLEACGFAAIVAPVNAIATITRRVRGRDAPMGKFDGGGVAGAERVAMDSPRFELVVALAKASELRYAEDNPYPRPGSGFGPEQYTESRCDSSPLLGPRRRRARTGHDPIYRGVAHVEPYHPSGEFVARAAARAIPRTLGGVSDELVRDIETFLDGSSTGVRSLDVANIHPAVSGIDAASIVSTNLAGASVSVRVVPREDAAPRTDYYGDGEEDDDDKQPLDWIGCRGADSARDVARRAVVVDSISIVDAGAASIAFCARRFGCERASFFDPEDDCWRL